MMTFDLRTDAAAGEYPALPGMVELADRLGRAHPALPEPLVLPWSEEHVLVLDGDRPWLVSPLDRDVTRLDGRVVVPRAVRRRLSALADAGTPVHELATAHELRPDGPVAFLLPLLRLGPRMCTSDVARRVVDPAPPHPAVERTVRFLDRIVRRGGADAAHVLDNVLDPLLFGVVGHDRPRHGDLCLWYPLAAWRW